MTKKFHERFNIKVPITEARERFINRAHSAILVGFINNFSASTIGEIRQCVATALGERYYHIKSIDDYIDGDFYKCLHAIETIYKLFRDDYSERDKLANRIMGILDMTEDDLGIRWENGQFIPAGAKLLDDKLVNESLRWLTKEGYESVLSPFSKGLDHFLHINRRPKVASDVVTDMYEALEALAKIVVGNDKDLSANREQFIRQVKASDDYKRILKEYIAYANRFRHAAKEGKPKPKITAQEAESFMYLTGVFIRLAISAA